MYLPQLWRDQELNDWDWDLATNTPSGLSISEDDKYVYVAASLPGVDPKDVEVTFDKGVVWIKGEMVEEEKDKKYYRKASSSFSYRVAIPGDIDMDHEPEATSKHGIMTVKFAKKPEAQPKKITVKSS